LEFERVDFQIRNTFLNYIFGGCEINLAIAIDFTGSNGDPKNDPNSLHCNNLNRNQYYQALKSVGEILKYYDSDKLFPCFGFGARLKTGLGGRDVSHCFALNGNIFDPECDGLEGVLEAYKNAIKKVELYGPTHFNKVVEMACDMA
jgi:hypothetical protein